MQAESVQADLKSTNVQVPVGPLVASAGRRLCENGCGRVSTSFDQDRFGQLKIKMSCCLRRLVWYVGGVALRTSALVPECGRAIKVHKNGVDQSDENKKQVMQDCLIETIFFIIVHRHLL